jgi:hypothetical protein
MLSVLHVKEYFNHFMNQTRFGGFASYPQKTYAEISHEFLVTFRFVHTKEKVDMKGKITPSTFDVKFFRMQHRFVMSLDEFCKAIDVPNLMSWEEIPNDNDASLQDFWRSISVDVPMDNHRGKFTHIQHPRLTYFALFLVRGFLARKNTTPCTCPIFTY